jgi:hypothetical protein
MVLVAVLGFAALVPGFRAFAADQEVIGKKLIITKKALDNTGTVVFLSKDPAIVKTAAGGAGDPILNGGSLRVITSLQDVSFPMPGPMATDGEWITNGGATIWKYHLGDGTAGDACKVSILKGGKVAKAVCRGPDIYALNIDASAPNASVEVQLATGNERYCSVFSAGNGCQLLKDGSFNSSFTVAKYRAKNCTTAPTLCSSPSGAFLEVAETRF